MRKVLKSELKKQFRSKEKRILNTGFIVCSVLFAGVGNFNIISTLATFTGYVIPVHVSRLMYAAESVSMISEIAQRFLGISIPSWLGWILFTAGSISF